MLVCNRHFSVLRCSHTIKVCSAPALGKSRFRLSLTLFSVGGQTAKAHFFTPFPA